MAGRPKEKRLRYWLETHVQRELDDHRATILDWACERIEAGATIQSLASELNEQYPDGVTRMLLHRVLYKQEGADERIALARRRGAPSLVEEAQEILDKAEPDRDELAKAKLTADVRLWQAERLDRATYGKEPMVQINQNTLTISDLHLDALTARQRPVLPAGRPISVQPDTQAVQAEIVDPGAS